MEAYCEDIGLVVETMESQHTEATPFLDDRMTLSGMPRGRQRRVYDPRRARTEHGITLIPVDTRRFNMVRDRLRRDAEEDEQVAREVLTGFLPLSSYSNVERFSRDSDPSVRGFLHHPRTTCGGGLVLTHGAGSNCQAPILVAVAIALAEAGFTVLRCDLPYRQERPHGPPPPGGSARDREGLHRAVQALTALDPMRPFGSVFLGGHSYGGRQATMLAAADPGLVDGLLLLSYPLHPPNRPAQLRTAHFPELRMRALFVHGSRDPFGTLEEMKSALSLIPAPTSLFPIEGAGHDLNFGRGGGIRPRAQPDRWAAVVEAFQAFIKM